MITNELFQDLARAIISGDTAKIADFIKQVDIQEDRAAYLKLFYLACVFDSPQRETILRFFVEKKLPLTCTAQEILETKYSYPEEVVAAAPKCNSTPYPAVVYYPLSILWQYCSPELFAESIIVHGLNKDKEAANLKTIICNRHSDGSQSLLNPAQMKQLIALNPQLVIKHFSLKNLSHDAVILLANSLPEFSFEKFDTALIIKWLNQALLAKNHLAIRTFLTRGVPVDLPLNAKGMTLFQGACKANDYELALLLESIGADIHLIYPEYKHNGLGLLLSDLIVGKKVLEDFRLLIWLAERLDLNLQNIYGETPALLACRTLSILQILPILLTHNPQYLPNSRQINWLDYLIKIPSPEVIALVEIITKKYPQEVLASDIKPNGDSTLINLCSLLENGEQNKEVLYAIMRILIAANFNVNYVRKDGVTALHFVACVCDATAMELLINAGAKVNLAYLENSILARPLDCVLQSKYSENAPQCAHLLIQAGAVCRKENSPLLNLLTKKTPASVNIKWESEAELKKLKQLFLKEDFAKTLEYLRANSAHLEDFIQPTSSIIELAALKGDQEKLKQLITQIEKLLNTRSLQRLYHQTIEQITKGYLATRKDESSLSIKKYLESRLPQTTLSVNSHSIAYVPASTTTTSLSLHNACRRGLTAAVQELLKDQDEATQAISILSYDDRGYTALHCACESGNENLVLLLKQKNVHFSVSTKTTGSNKLFTPLCVLIASEQYALIHKILPYVNWQNEPLYTEENFKHWTRSHKLTQQILKLSHAAHSAQSAEEISGGSSMETLSLLSLSESSDAATDITEYSEPDVDTATTADPLPDDTALIPPSENNGLIRVDFVPAPIIRTTNSPFGFFSPFELPATPFPAMRSSSRHFTLSS